MVNKQQKVLFEEISKDVEDEEINDVEKKLLIKFTFQECRYDEILEKMGCDKDLYYLEEATILNVYPNGATKFLLEHTLPSKTKSGEFEIETAMVNLYGYGRVNLIRSGKITESFKQYLNNFSKKYGLRFYKEIPYNEWLENIKKRNGD